MQKHRRCEACGRRDGASGGAAGAGAGESWRHRAVLAAPGSALPPALLHRSSLPPRAFPGTRMFSEGWCLWKHHWELRSRDTRVPAGSACMFGNQGREAPSAQSGVSPATPALATRIKICVFTHRHSRRVRASPSRPRRPYRGARQTAREMLQRPSPPSRAQRDATTLVGGALPEPV